MKELTKEQNIELYDLMYPKSLEDDIDIKAIDVEEILQDGDTVIILKLSELKKISDWMIAKGLWS
tara:strand:- start:795 stop:989 length:195 start_codon:yes stop_codon:yes gene_type:complete